MDELPHSVVSFRKREVKRAWFGKYIDSLIIPWMSLDEASRRRLGRAGLEINRYVKHKEKEEQRESDPFLMMFRECEEAPDLRSAIIVIAQIYKRVGVSPSLDIGRDLSDFFDVKLDDEEWRDDRNIEWNLSGDDVSKLFRFSLWTLRHLEHVAEKIVKHSPNDFGIRNLFGGLRSYVYQQVRELSSSAVNAGDFFQEIGRAQFCPHEDVRIFWKAVGLEQEARRAHPVDRRLSSEPKFISAMRVFNATLDTHAEVGTLTFADRGAATRLNGQVEFVIGLWESVMGDLFHLGPTVGLLEWTELVLKAISNWLSTADEAKVGPTGEAYRKEVTDTIAAYREAAEPLLKALSATAK